MPPSTIKKKKYRIAERIIIAAAFLLLHYALGIAAAANLIPGGTDRWQPYLPILDKLSIALFAVMIILLAGKLIERLIDNSSQSHGVRYNLVRLTRLLTTICVGIVGMSFLFQNLYAAAVSFGVISLVLGFALQAPITSFIGWIYIVIRQPYQVGDRIQLGTLRGDVIELGYLDTRIRECAGDYLQNDRLSGRIIHVPNSFMLKSEVINYGGQFRPYIWNETALQLDYASDLPFVEDCLKQAADTDFAQLQQGREPDTRHQSAVYFRTSHRGWLEAVISYPVRPIDTTGRRNRILALALPLLNAQPHRVRYALAARNQKDEPDPAQDPADSAALSPGM